MAKTKKEEGNLPGGINQLQLDEWKRANPEGVVQLDVVVQNEEKDESGKVTQPKKTATIYLKDPFNKPSVITEAMGKDTKHEMQEYILGALFLGGDKAEVFENKKAKYWAGIQAYRLIEVNETAVKKA